MSQTFNETSTLEAIADVTYQIIMAPFHGAMVSVKARKLTDAQISECGPISLIETFEDKIRQKKGKHNMREILAYCDRMNKIVRKALVAPTYEQIMEVVANDEIVHKSRVILDELKAKLKSTPSGFERRALEEEIDSLAVWTDLLLPEDFLGTIVAWTLSVNDSDIKEVTESMLLEAAILAEKGHDNPHNHISGRFTPFHEKDIDKRSWAILKKERDKLKHAG